MDNVIRLVIFKHSHHDKKISYIVFGSLNFNSSNKKFGQYEFKDFDTCKDGLLHILNQVLRLRSKNIKIEITMSVFDDIESTEKHMRLLEYTEYPSDFNNILSQFSEWEEQTKELGYKSYYEQNKEKIIKNALDHYNTHKEEINVKRKIKVVCDVCNGHYTMNNKSIHIKTKKHIDALEKNSKNQNDIGLNINVV